MRLVPKRKLVSGLETTSTTIVQQVLQPTEEYLPASIFTNFIKNSAISTGKLEDLAVTTAKINSLAVTTAKIDALAVTTAKIGLLAVTTALIDDLAVTTGKINTLAVTNAKIFDLAVNKLTAGTMTANVVIANTFKTAASPNPRIEIDASYIAGYSDATTKQFYLSSTDGKGYFGAGNCWLDTGGITLKGEVPIINFLDVNSEPWGYIALATADDMYIVGGSDLILHGTVIHDTFGHTPLGSTIHYWSNIVSDQYTLRETTTPTAVGDWGKVYTKNDNKLYFQDGAGTEHTVTIS